jgi:hypothetical protein
VKPYFDFTFLPLLAMRTPQARWAEGLAAAFSLPWAVNYLHFAQLENLFVRLQLEGNAAQQRAGLAVAALWRARLSEGIFAVENPPWDDAWRVTIGLHRELVAPVPQPSHLLHISAAQLTGATHYFSLHPPIRQLAKQLGLAVLPEKL